MLKAIGNINGEIATMLMGQEASNQRVLDEMMIKADGTENKGRLGGNAMLGVSLAVARAQAVDEKMPLYKYLRKAYGIGEIGWKLPKPMIVMIEGGKHADETTDLQEFMVGTLGERSATENVRMEMEIYEALKKLLKADGLSDKCRKRRRFCSKRPKNK